jgi:hypothetical protein
VVQQAELRSGLEFAQHPRHRRENGKPFVHQQRLVDTHADQKQDKIALDGGRHALAVDHRRPSLIAALGREYEPKHSICPGGAAAGGIYTGRICARVRR